MSKRFIRALALCVLTVGLAAGCNEPQPQPMPQPMPVQPPAPVQPAVAQPAPPPPTPLVPLTAAEPVQQPGAKSSRSTSGGGGGANVDKEIKGPETSGDELLGNYACNMDLKGLKLPLGMKLPSFGCRIYRASDGTVKLGPSSQSVASLQGTIQDPKATGFFMVGGYKFPGNEFRVKTRMIRKGAGTFSGAGRATLNDDKKTKVKYTLSMEKK